VICFKFDRIIRSIRDFIEIREFLAEHDVAIISIREDIDSSGIAGESALKILMVIAEFERRQVAERTIAIMEDRVGRGLQNGGVVYGYISDPKQPGKLLVDPEWAHLLLAERLSTCRSAGPRFACRHVNPKLQQFPLYCSRRSKILEGIEEVGFDYEKRQLPARLQAHAEQTAPAAAAADATKTFIDTWNSVGELLEQATAEVRRSILQHYVEVVEINLPG
jgi:hypothetical protein